MSEKRCSLAMNQGRDCVPNARGSMSDQHNPEEIWEQHDEHYPACAFVRKGLRALLTELLVMLDANSDCVNDLLREAKDLSMLRRLPK